MKQKKTPTRVILVLTTVGVLACLGVLITLIIQIWPLQLLRLSEAEANSLSVEDRLAAEASVRNSILSAVAGFIALGVSVAALRQASLSRKVHLYQKNIDWAGAFTDAANMMSDENPIKRVAGVIALCALDDNKSADSRTDNLNTTLASFIRSATAKDSDATYRALEYISANRNQKRYSIEGALLRNLNLSDLSLEGIDLTRVSFRGSQIPQSYKSLIEKFEGVDVGDVRWIPST